ncbi:biotin transporter BioY [Pseudooceanicola sp. CBS1P-1]|uniref:Biotin transporter n=1 Tax=Pseudooceanicola albus TaxID=2692189 RepID=A0A6L7G7N9_9RHOB|nr:MULTISPECIES: biotin transporter BioY [Pseudooceanicola]MBT9386011.1 biotin transporter BioY [Pseudooceanicola endophyticus]MXN19568.1 BioY family transporter [Pseudooceanicola albus]
MEKTVSHVALFAAVIAVLGLMPKLTLAFGIPVTAQSMGIMLAGAILGARRGALAVLVFLLLVALGLPLLAGGRGGLGVFVGPTAGFLAGWVAAAFVTGLIVERWRSAPLGLVAGVASVIGGIVVLYAFGVVGMALVLHRGLLESAGLVLIFVPGDIVKAAITAALTVSLARARPQSLLSRA